MSVIILEERVGQAYSLPVYYKLWKSFLFLCIQRKERMVFFSKWEVIVSLA